MGDKDLEDPGMETETVDVPVEQLGDEQEVAAPEPFVPERGKSTRRIQMQAIRSSAPDFVGKTQDYVRQSKKLRIIIPSTETQKDDVFLSVNGVNRLIRRDTEVDLEMPFIEALNHSTMTVFTQVKRPDGEGYDMIPRDVMRFPYRTVTT